METHAHHLHHAPGKKFRHYLYEFLMLFLAVFCGFLAENLREHYVEQKREREFMTSMVKDLMSDTANFSASSRGILNMNAHIDSIIPLLSNNGEMEKRATEIYQQDVWISLYYKFIYTDRTIEQLKNSGSFRLIRNKTVSDAIIEYDGFVRNYVITMQDEALLYTFKKVDDCRTGIFKSAVFRDWFKNGFNSHLIQLPPAPYFLSTEKKQVDVYINLLTKYQVYNYWFTQNAGAAITKAISLDSLIKKEYHL